jgi:hypothetical protein
VLTDSTNAVQVKVTGVRDSRNTALPSTGSKPSSMKMETASFAYMSAVVYSPLDMVPITENDSKNVYYRNFKF